MRTAKIAELEKRSSQPNFWENNQIAQAVLKEVAVHRRWVEQHSKLVEELNDNEELLTITDIDGDHDDADQIIAAMDELSASIEKFEFEALLSGEDDHRCAIVSIHPGAGGTESQDWAEMLFRMYNRWAERRNWTVELMDYQPGEEAGLKSATFEVKGDYVYGHFRAERGVHRLVRISPFDANSRRHTSFVGVHVYPVVEDNVEIEIKEDDIRIDTYRASGAGGQHVNKTSSAIRIT
ncbi:MAG: PCRF domain-containing protein, partial [Candidatus Zixiibacteriota bacterium]